MKPVLDAGQHLPAIVIMTDGKSQGAMNDVRGRVARRRPARAGVRRHVLATMPTAASSTARHPDRRESF